MTIISMTIVEWYNSCYDKGCYDKEMNNIINSPSFFKNKQVIL